MGKVKKILAGVLVVAVAGCGISAGLMQLRKSSQKTVDVTPVSGLLQEFYTHHNIFLMKVKNYIEL